MAVDRGIPEHPVEPRHQPFVWHVGQSVQVARERVLQEVFGQRPVANSPLEESQKGPVVLDEHACNSGAVVRRIWLSGARLRHMRSIGTGHGASTDNSAAWLAYDDGL